jgi:hypothetical protein
VQPGPTAAVVALAILVVVALRSRRSARGVVLARLRVLVPAWRLFDRATASPRLFVRSAAPHHPLGDWTALAAAPRGWASWAFAPAGNLALAYQSVVEQLVAALGELGEVSSDTDPAVTGLVEYDLVTAIARAYIPTALRDQAGARLQWKVMVPNDSDDGGAADYLVSPELAA